MTMLLDQRIASRNEERGALWTSWNMTPGATVATPGAVARQRGPAGLPAQQVVELELDAGDAGVVEIGAPHQLRSRGAERIDPLHLGRQVNAALAARPQRLGQGGRDAARDPHVARPA